MEKELTNEQLQVLLTGTFGDGTIRLGLRNGTYNSNCKKLGYLEYKAELLGNLFRSITKIEKNGYSQTYIYNLKGLPSTRVREIHVKTLEEKLELMDDLGMALWFYDDGSLHKKNKFYNLNTHSFSLEDNTIISNFLNKKYNIRSKVISETKKDGRIFWYIYIPATGGSHIISEILSKFYVEDYSYKILDQNYYEILKSDVDTVLKDNPKSSADEIAKYQIHTQPFLGSQ